MNNNLYKMKINGPIKMYKNETYIVFNLGGDINMIKTNNVYRISGFKQNWLLDEIIIYSKIETDKVDLYSINLRILLNNNLLDIMRKLDNKSFESNIY